MHQQINMEVIAFPSIFNVMDQVAMYIVNCIRSLAKGIRMVYRYHTGYYQQKR